MAKFGELLSKLEELKNPSRELDGELWSLMAVKSDVTYFYGELHGQRHFEFKSPWFAKWRAPRFTSSIDDALILIRKTCHIYDNKENESTILIKVAGEFKNQFIPDYRLSFEIAKNLLITHLKFINEISVEETW